MSDKLPKSTLQGVDVILNDLGNHSDIALSIARLHADSGTASDKAEADRIIAMIRLYIDEFSSALPTETRVYLYATLGYSLSNNLREYFAVKKKIGR